MRWIVVSVLVLNVVVYVVQTLELQQRMPQDQKYSRRPIPPDAQSIMLLSEIKLLPGMDGLNYQGSPGKSVESEKYAEVILIGETRALDASDTETGRTGGQSVARAEDGQEKLRRAGNTAGKDSEGNKDNNKELSLLSDDISPGSEKTAVAVLTPAEAKCILVGPLDEPTRAERIRAELEKKQVAMKVHDNQVELSPEYWVYLEPLESRKVAIVRLKELQVRKIDSFLISQGSLRNGISLGLFRNEESAKRLRDRRIAQGYDARIRELPKHRNEFWLVSEEEINVQSMARISGTLDELGEKTKARQIFCKSVASGIDLP